MNRQIYFPIAGMLVLLAQVNALAQPASAAASNACAVKVKSIKVCGSKSCFVGGLMEMSAGIESNGPSQICGMQAVPPTVYVFREFAGPYKAQATTYSLQIGKAYLLQKDKSYKYVCDVDLSLPDEKIAKLLGIKV